MKIIGFIVFILFACANLKAQVSDSFSDGDFTNNPMWTPDAANNWTVINNQLRSNSATANSTFYISTPSTQALNAQWEFYVNLQFNTSSANYVDVYLTSSNATMAGANGYFVRIGGTPDEISLYKSTAGTSSILINGTDGITNSSNNILRIKIIRSASNMWSLQRDVTGTGNNYVSEGTVTDNSFTTSAFFGLRITQSTSSFFSKHFFDNFYAGPIILDTSPPVLNSVSTISSSELNLVFNESLEVTSSQNISNYSVDNGIDKPLSASLQADLKTVKLTFIQPFGNGIQNQLTVSSVKDLAGNTMGSSSLPFLYFLAVAENKNDIIISEIFPDPDPIIGLPSAEFIEIYNRSSNPFDLTGWKLSDGVSTASFGSQIILPQQYWMVTASTNAALFSAYQNVIGVSNFPSLNNSGDLITLRSSTGLTVDSLNYSLSWYRDADKQQGGWTLERIDLNKSSTDPLNWIASQDTSGGTPGKQNSWFGKNPDVTPPKLLSLIVKNDSQLELTFDEALDPTSILVSNFNVNNGIGNPSSFQLSSDAKTVSLSFNSKFQNGAENQLILSNIADVFGNKIQPITSTFYYLITIPAKAQDIIVTEIFPDPDPIIGLPSAEFIEIYNRSSNPFDLTGWKLSDGVSTASFGSQIILPQQYWIVTSSTNAPLFSAYQNVIGVSNFPSLNNSGDLITLRSSSGLTIDSLNYSLSWYRDADKQQGGWSLERIDLNKTSTDASNWIASQDASGGTPGKQNSWFGKNPDVTPPKILSTSVKNDSQLELTFDEALDPTSIVVGNFSVNNGIGNPSSFQVSNDAKTILLSFNSKFQNGVENQLIISNIADIVGNKIQPIISTFYYLITIPAKAQDIIVTEIFPDPDPIVGLPSAEFIEIYNRSSNPFDLTGWKLSDGVSTANFGSQIILPQQYWIVTASTNAALFSAYQNVIGVSNFPSLNNSGDLITLRSSTGLTVDSLNYSLSWYRDADKQQGGWSLERIDLNKTSTDASNWIASQDASGGTPGKQNSWFGKNPDVTPPKLLSTSVKNDSQLELTFDEALDPTSIVVGNFSVNNGIGNPSSFQLSNDAKTILLLSFNSKFQNGVENSLSINLISDIVGNKMSSLSQTFTFIVASPSTFKDIIITEILPDPTPAIGLPDAEFIELYNRSKVPFDLFGWSFQAGKSISKLPHQIILPQQYLIVTNSKSATKFLPYGKVISMADFPTLTNEGQSLRLRNEKNQTIDSLNYATSWYRNSDKAQGGWSLELIDPNNICGEEDNWIASENNVGGTPGKQNSVIANKPDLTGPKLINLLPEKENVLLLSFDEKLDLTSVDIDKYRIEPLINISKIYFTDLSKRQVRLELQSSLQKRQLYSLTLQRVYDCAGNEIQKEFSQLFFALPEEIEVSDLLINEILFNPRTGGVDFVEVYNNSQKYISLNDCKLANVESGVLKNIQPLISQSLLEPNQYRVFTTDPSILKNNYPQGEEKKFVKTTLPSLPDDAGSIAIVNKSAIVIDSFFYNKNFHSSFIKDEQGVSLERISFAGNGNDANNWKSASSQSGFATPGYQNSNARSTELLLGEKIKVDPEIIIPNSGQQDFAKINYAFDQNNFIANVKILDQQGRLIKVIANNETLGYSGFFRWDGNTDDGSKARMGYYIVWIDLFDETGVVNTFRKRVIVASP